MKRLQSYPPIDGQLDVFDVLELVEQEGLVPNQSEMPEEREALDDRLREPLEEIATSPDDGMHICRGAGYSFWVCDETGESLHGDPFWSQIECWAFMIGYRLCAARSATRDGAGSVGRPESPQIPAQAVPRAAPGA